MRCLGRWAWRDTAVVAQRMEPAFAKFAAGDLGREFDWRISSRRGGSLLICQNELAIRGSATGRHGFLGWLNDVFKFFKRALRDGHGCVFRVSSRGESVDSRIWNNIELGHGLAIRDAEVLNEAPEVGVVRFLNRSACP